MGASRNLGVLRMTAKKPAAYKHGVITKVPHVIQAIKKIAYAAVTGGAGGNVRTPCNPGGWVVHGSVLLTKGFVCRATFSEQQLLLSD
jgi:hypothetical protein